MRNETPQNHFRHPPRDTALTTTAFIRRGRGTLGRPCPFPPRQVPDSRSSRLLRAREGFVVGPGLLVQAIHQRPEATCMRIRGQTPDPGPHGRLDLEAASRLRLGNRVMGFDEKPGPSRYRGYRVATVVALTIGTARTLTLGTEFGEVTCTTDHRWLERNRFRSTATIRELRLATMPVLPPAFGAGYKMGYLHGALAGDGNFSHGPAQTRATLRVCDEKFAARFAHYGQDLGFEGFRTIHLRRGVHEAAPVWRPHESRQGGF